MCSGSLDRFGWIPFKMRHIFYVLPKNTEVVCVVINTKIQSNDKMRKHFWSHFFVLLIHGNTTSRREVKRKKERKSTITTENK